MKALFHHFSKPFVVFGKKTQQLHILSTKKEQDLYIFTLCDFAITWVFWDGPWTRKLGIPSAIWTKNLALD